MKKVLYLTVCLFLLTNLSWAAERVVLTDTDQPPSVEVLQSTGDRILLNYTISAFDRSEIAIDGQTYTLIGSDGESRIWETGSPDLPRLCRSVVIPDDALMAVQVISAEYREITGVKIAPSKGHLLRSVNPAEVPFEFGEVYQQDAWYPQSKVALRDPYIMRDLRGQVVELYPFQYNPVSEILRVYTDITVELKRAGTGGENVLIRSGELTSLDREFKRIYQRRFVNYNPLDYTLVEEIGPMLVIAYDGFYNAVMPLVNWKNQKGIATSIVKVSEIGNNATDIKSYINSVYRTEGLTFVLIVGDAQQVATPSNGEDPTYAQLTGNDHYPELFVGRLSAQNFGELNTQVERILTYERFPTDGGDWYHKGTGIASNEGPGHYGEYDDEHIEYIRHDLLVYGYTEVDQFYQPNANASMVTNALNEGRSTINYCGHGGSTGWSTTGYNNGHVNNLTNDYMLPFITSVACNTGQFHNTTCFGEAWLRATNNGKPTGAIGFWGSTIGMSWSPPMYAQDEFIDLLCADLMHSYGGLCFNGVGEMIDQTGYSGNNETDHWVILGDPSLQVRTDTPYELAVTHDDQMNASQTSFEVTVTGIQDALAALSYNGELMGYAYTNASGYADITITGNLPQNAIAALTVTAYNAVPYVAPIQVGLGGSDLNVDLTYVSGSPVPSGGGNLVFDLALENTGSDHLNFDIWFEVSYEGGTPTTIVSRCMTGFAPGSSIIREDINFPVPASYPGGDYLFASKVGINPFIAWDQSSFSFVKSGTDAVAGFIPFKPSGELLSLFDGDKINSSIEDIQPSAFMLHSNHPNPFNPTTTIGYELPEAARITLSVYDVSGRQVAGIVDGWREAGFHEVNFDASNLTSGIYIYHLRADDFSAIGKMVLMK